MKTEIESIALRAWELRDAPALQRAADFPQIVANLRNRFPSPYTIVDAEQWVSFAGSAQMRPINLAIVEGDVPVGGVALEVNDPAEVHAGTAEIGYWLTPGRWGRGIATAVVRAASAHWIAERGLERLQAGVYDWNPASARVLEKSGFSLEGRLRRHVTKNGRVGDVLLYARFPERAAAPSQS